MKKVWIAVTAALAVLILGVGIVLLPVLYSMVFDVEKIVYEEEELPEGLSDSPGFFMDRFRYPLWEETETLAEEARVVQMADCRRLLGGEVYERMFRLVGLEETEHYWEGLSSVKEENLYVMQAAADKNGESCLFSAAFDDGLLPFLVCCERSQVPSEAEVSEAVMRLEELCEPGQEGLRFYTEEIDGIYENCQEYQNRLRMLYTTLLSEEAGVREIAEEVSLWEVCAMGEWQVCSDGKEAVLVCVMGAGNLVLYYDAAEKGFCGYRIWFGDAG